MSTNARILSIDTMTVEIEDFIEQFNEDLQRSKVWKGELVTQTSQTLIEFISAVGTFDQARIIRTAEDAYSESAQSDEAILAIAQMQGLRITRKEPAAIAVELSAPDNTTIGPYTQFSIGGISYFNREQIEVSTGATPAELYQGIVKSVITTGKSTDFQAFIGPANDANFSITDSDVQVRINGELIPKSYGVLWNFKGKDAFVDLTMPDGRLLVQFGNSRFGTVPYINDVVLITYVVTEGDTGNNAVLSGRNVSTDEFPNVVGIATSNPTGGTGTKPIVVYKNVAAGAFGTYESAVTKTQYTSVVSTYPGIIDAVTQAQREINPMDLQWMNTIRVSGLTNHPWTQTQKRRFIEYLQSVTMYSSRFYWLDAEPMLRDIEIEVYFFNTAILSEGKALAEKAIIDLLAPKPGLLMTNHYESDFDTAIKKGNPGQVSYVKVIRPRSGELVVTAPSSPDLEYSFIAGAGTDMRPGVYSYAVAVTNAQDAGPPNGWVFPQITNAMSDTHAIKLTWPEVRGAVSYRVYGRRGGDVAQPLGLMDTISATNGDTASWTDTGLTTPTPPLPSSISESPIRYNKINTLVVRPFYSSRQTRLPTQTNRD